MQENYLEEKGIYYRMNEFKSDRLTLVFVHGVSGSSSAWIPYEKVFENKYNILTYDIRGHGKSKKYPNHSDYEIKNFVEDLHSLLLHLNIKKIILISNSFAALVHFEYIKLYRDTVLANVFTSPEVYLEKTPMAKIVRPVLHVFTHKVLPVLPFNPRPRGHVDYKNHINSTDWNIKRNIADMKNTGIHAHFYSLGQSLVPDKKYDLEKINVPTLIMHGEKDTMIPMKNSITMSKEIKNSVFISIPYVDHNTVHNGVKVISEAILSFLEKNKNLL